MSRKVMREAEETEANEGGSGDCSLVTVLYFIRFCGQPPLPPTKLGAAKTWPAYGIDTPILSGVFFLLP